jgi:maleate cis-trans isomerase
MEKHVSRVLEEAASAEPDIIAYGYTASSATGDPSAYCAKLYQTSGTETVTAAGALLAALQALAGTRVALVTPYPPAVNAHEVSYFAQNGVQVLGDESVIVDDAQLQMRHMSRVPTHTLVSRAVALVSKHDVEGIVLSCCDLPTTDAIAEIEAKTGLAVVSSAQALFWQSLRAAGISDAIDGYGQLLRNH